MTLKEIYPLGSAATADQIYRRHKLCREAGDHIGMLTCQLQYRYRDSAIRAESDARASKAVADAVSLGLV